MNLVEIEEAELRMLTEGKRKESASSGEEPLLEYIVLVLCFVKLEVAAGDNGFG